MMKAGICRILAAVTALAATAADAGIVYSNVAYGASNAAQAEANLIGLSGGAYATETFDGTLGMVGNIGAGNGSSDQSRWLAAADSFQTRVGTFSMTTPEVGTSSNDVAAQKLMLEDSTTGEFGRQTGYNSRWLDSNDADAVTWDIGSTTFPMANAFGFYLSDANDQGASLKLIFDDGTQFIQQLSSGLANGNLLYASFISDQYITGASLVFDNGSYKNDGWGIDNVTVAKVSVPEPSTLALLGLGLVGLMISRRRLN